MTYQFPCSFWKISQRVAEQGTVKRSGFDHTQHAIRRSQPSALHSLLEAGCESVQHSYLPVSFPQSVLTRKPARMQRRRGDKRIARAGQAGASLRSDRRAQTRRKDVGVFVGVKV